MPSDNQAKPRLKAPAGTCDTHIHIYDSRYPVAATAKVMALDALVPNYMKVRERLGIDRTVIVQPSAYGTDNRCLLAAMAAIGESARGVAVVDAGVSEAELERLTRLGIRGLRFFMLAGAPLPLEKLEPLAARIHPFGWHVVFQMDGRDLAEREALLKQLPCPVIVDHTGKFIEPVPTSHPGFRALLRLLDTGRVWVKLAAPYETSKLGPPTYDDVGVLAKTLAKAAPERMLWATNWPHPSPGVEKPDDAWMLDLLLDWIPDEGGRRLALVDNPAALYGF